MTIFKFIDNLALRYFIFVASLALVGGGCASTSNDGSPELVFVSDDIEQKKSPVFIQNMNIPEGMFRKDDVFFTYIWIGDENNPKSYPSSYCICIAWNSNNNKIVGGYLPFPADAADDLYPSGVIGRISVNGNLNHDPIDLIIDFDPRSYEWIKAIKIKASNGVTLVSGELDWDKNIPRERIKSGRFPNIFDSKEWRTASYYRHMSNDDEINNTMFAESIDEDVENGSPEIYMFKNGISDLWHEEGLAIRLYNAIK